MKQQSNCEYPRPASRTTLCSEQLLVQSYCIISDKKALVGKFAF